MEAVLSVYGAAALLKENQSLLVATFGIVLATRRHWRPAFVGLPAA